MILVTKEKNAIPLLFRWDMWTLKNRKTFDYPAKSKPNGTGCEEKADAEYTLFFF